MTDPQATCGCGWQKFGYKECPFDHKSDPSAKELSGNSGTLNKAREIVERLEGHTFSCADDVDGFLVKEIAAVIEAESAKADFYRNILLKIKQEVAERDYGKWGNRLHAFLKEAGL